MIATYCVVYDRVYDENLKKKVPKYNAKERMFSSIAWIPKGDK